MSDINPISHATASPPSNPRPSTLIYGLLACLTGFLANALPFCFILNLFKYPPGTSMRPMLEASMIILGTLVGLIIALPLSLICLTKSRHSWFGWLLGLSGCLLALSPWFLNNALFNWIVAKRGFILEP